MSVREAFKDFLKTHLSESSEEEMMQMEKMFVAMLPRRPRDKAQISYATHAEKRGIGALSVP